MTMELLTQPPPTDLQLTQTTIPEGIHLAAGFQFDHRDTNVGKEQRGHGQDQKETRNGSRIVQLAGLDLETARFVVQQVLLNVISQSAFIQRVHRGGLTADDELRLFVGRFGVVGQGQMDITDRLSQNSDVVIEVGMSPGWTEPGHSGNHSGARGYWTWPAGGSPADERGQT
jgi:hypothetical protein